jgi:hypothetical protein
VKEEKAKSSAALELLPLQLLVRVGYPINIVYNIVYENIKQIRAQATSLPYSSFLFNKVCHLVFSTLHTELDPIIHLPNALHYIITYALSSQFISQGFSMN